MVNTKITDNPEYLDIIKFIVGNEPVRSYHITKYFNIDKGHNTKCNFSMKLQRLKKIGFIESSQPKNRARHGKYSTYSVDWTILISTFFNYLMIKLGANSTIKFLFDYGFFKKDIEKYKKLIKFRLNNPIDNKNPPKTITEFFEEISNIWIESNLIYLEKKLKK